MSRDNEFTCVQRQNYCPPCAFQCDMCIEIDAKAKKAKKCIYCELVEDLEDATVCSTCKKNGYPKKWIDIEDEGIEVN